LTYLDNSYQAHFVENALEEEGIRPMVLFLNSHALFPFERGLMGEGIEVRVIEADLESARAILDKVRMADVLACPDCGSVNLSYGVGMKDFWLTLLAIFMTLLVNPLAAKLAFLYKCRDCGKEFRKSKI
jgi:DNA-directed RNA polymerase subunit RPC12/RpoP